MFIDLTNGEGARSPARLVETYSSQDGKSGYRKWSDGWVEQWYDFTSNMNTITFLVPFADTNYIVSKLLYSSSNAAISGAGLCVSNKTTTSLKDGSSGSSRVNLVLRGFAAG